MAEHQTHSSDPAPSEKLEPTISRTSRPVEVPRTPKPRARVLVAANALFWFVLLGVAGMMSGLLDGLLLAIALGFILTVTTTAQVCLHFTFGRRLVHPLARSVLYFTPTLALIVFALICPKPELHRNQREDLVSPSGEFILSVPIEIASKESPHKGWRVWKVTIRNDNGEVVYRDIDSGFLGHFNVYWIWDDTDRAWLHNSDDGTIYFWQEVDGKWEKHLWEQGRTEGRVRKTERNIAPPDTLWIQDTQTKGKRIHRAKPQTQP